MIKIIKNFSRWNEALLSGNPEIVANLYTEDATFLPTLSPEFKKGRLGAVEYFSHFLKKNPSGKIIEEKIQFFNDELYSHSGLYDFEVDSGEGKRSLVNARFTFIWQKRNDEWKIVHHHSSLKP